MEITLETIAHNIVTQRKLHKYTQAKVASKLFVSERNYRRYETQGTYDINVINQIAKLYSISPLELLS